VVRTRTVVCQAHTQQWIGTFSGAGNGEYRAELTAACRAITAYLQAKGLPLEAGVVRLDGLYGDAAILAQLGKTGLQFVLRGATTDYSHIRTCNSVSASLITGRCARPKARCPMRFSTSGPCGSKKPSANAGSLSPVARLLRQGRPSRLASKWVSTSTSCF
jgi:hypothetical protein